jgi:hypothetical protein
MVILKKNFDNWYLILIFLIVCIVIAALHNYLMNVLAN